MCAWYNGLLASRSHWRAAWHRPPSLPAAQTMVVRHSEIATPKLAKYRHRRSSWPRHQPGLVWAGAGNRPKRADPDRHPDGRLFRGGILRWKVRAHRAEALRRVRSSDPFLSCGGCHSFRRNVQPPRTHRARHKCRPLGSCRRRSRIQSNEILTASNLTPLPLFCELGRRSRLFTAEESPDSTGHDAG